MKESKKVRVNITVDARNLKKAKKKLKYFGGKLSTLFDAYLEDFVKSMGRDIGESHEILLKRVKELEARVGKIERKN